MRRAFAARRAALLPTRARAAAAPELFPDGPRVRCSRPLWGAPHATDPFEWARSGCEIYFFVQEAFYPELLPDGLCCPKCRMAGGVASQGWVPGSPRFVVNGGAGLFVHYK